eukprot:CAMPEP_0175082830 /NCGR_PEP_ID=MMETSP0052_2-20121109/26985_1 /TAXON_ID=51329 ORGANISM="Polytomella parva, Strain SAG 63-3" /NCGR_SAMPLE_ID=MMETSP0052_2 /ASSEMBLY_ACC=CAM_ASM_000194 /LENGTH=188 /DNA_ID=CAMNT_0016354093 /DNA_START=148 /DNA_END=714 /DNA_ORIENTATION=+
MSKRKGLSLDEKREKMLSIFHESSDVFVLKDIEKLSMKKGIILQTVKDVLQWSFPSEASVKLENQAKKLKTDLEAVRKRREEVEENLREERQKKEESEDRTARLAELRKLKKDTAEASEKLSQYKDNDPELFEKIKQANDLAKDAANRWLDNLFSLKSWCKKRFVGKEAELATFFEENGFDDSLEYLE